MHRTRQHDSISKFTKKKHGKKFSQGVTGTGYYFITVSPRERFQNPKLLYYNDIRIMRPILNKCSDHYLIYPEFSSKSRLHYHGIIRITSDYKWHANMWRLKAYLGFVCMEKIEDHMQHMRCMIYSSKDYWKNRNIFKNLFMYKRDGTPYDEPIGIKEKRSMYNDYKLNNIEEKRVTIVKNRQSDIIQKTIFDFM